MSKTQQMTGRYVHAANTPFDSRQARIPTDAEVRDAMRRGRQLQARAIVSLFSRLGK
jgi:hypothetical protein